MGKIFSGAGILTNTALQVRSCGCNLLTFNFEGLLLSTWNQKGEDAVKTVDSSGFAWNLAYLDSFPGTNMIKRAAFRHFCNHCMENYKLDGTIGMGSLVYKDRV